MIITSFPPIAQSQACCFFFNVPDTEIPDYNLLPDCVVLPVEHVAILTSMIAQCPLWDWAVKDADSLNKRPLQDLER